jgi:aspartyl-tRNA(Asn)/glutamyl-tRNA(Gln) amidotransferase subunit A
MDKYSVETRTTMKAIDCVNSEVTAVALTEMCLKTIEQLNPQLSAMITVTPEIALASAAEADRAWTEGRTLGILHGMPVTLKDQLATAGIRTTMGAGFFSDHIPKHDAGIVSRLKQAGAVILGKDNMHELASGQTTQNPFYGHCKNPWDPKRLPGGSSGGSAVAVASGMTVGAVGTDMGGSARVPAALCGVAGLRPTFGSVSAWNDGLPDLLEYNTPGPMARRVSDVARLYVAMRAFDPRDPLSEEGPEQDMLETLRDGITGMRVGVASGPFFENADTEILDGLHKATATLDDLGATLVPVAFDRGELEALVEHFLVIRLAQGTAEFEGRLAEDPAQFGPDVRELLERGRKITGVDYARAHSFRIRYRHRLQRVFEDVDVVVGPTSPVAAPLIDAPPWWMPKDGWLGRVWSMTGMPALSIPCGFTRNRLPIGMEVAAPRWCESRLFRLGVAYQESTEWHRQVPPLGQDIVARAEQFPPLAG